MHVFLSETHPNSVVMAERAPEPGWREVKPAALPESAVRSTPEPSRLSLSDLIAAMSTALGEASPLRESPGDAFHRLAELRARAEGCSLTEAYSRQSESTPELWADVRNAAPRGY